MPSALVIAANFIHPIIQTDKISFQGATTTGEQMTILIFYIAIATKAICEARIKNIINTRSFKLRRGGGHLRAQIFSPLGH